ncbi:WD40/YVTN/BNR-like repeat-containing protein [Puia dinghuensis]|uniref:Sortilin N-terminal domain-containing protein n=1 Tax=Puia dinghuensis TaxID=1792502 RepID=A0A8J2UEG7_9BACT|nr:T9SS type A sorting domain-containing protein [Puia dinghuensis]GGB04215.1 hypothetical protein GCM10011511_29410 [Puia dinghuensis]
MKQPLRTRLVLASAILTLCTGLCCRSPHQRDKDDEEEKDAGIDKELSAWWWSRAYPDPTNIGAKYMQAWQQALAMRPSPSHGKMAEGVKTVTGGSNPITYTTGNWAPIGPSTGIGGRIITIAISPSNGNNLFCGAASGGIWKSTDGGNSWTSVSTGYPVLGVSSIIINPSNANIIFAGTGEIYRMDSTVTTADPSTTGFNVWKTRGTYGVGILRSTNGGATWNQVFVKTEANMFGIQKLKFNPVNPNSIYACGTDGLYRSTDGGTTWNQVIAKNYVSDVVVDAKDTTQIVIGVGNLQNTDKGIYKSTNNGSTWTKITSGLPATFQGLIRLDNIPTKGNRDTIIAGIGVNETGSNELYRSTNFGTTWTVLNNSAYSQYQFWCANAVAINPSSTSNVLYAGVSMYSYNIGSGSSAGDGSIHSDIHDIKFDPSNSNNVYVTCDGGVYKSTDGGSSFSQIDNGLQAVQFYNTIGYSTTADILVGGLQDNGVVMYNSGSWSNYPGGYGDGASCFIAPTNNSIILTSGDARNLYISNNGGASASNSTQYWGAIGDSRTAFVAPLAISKSNPKVMYVASDNLHVSTNGGASFSGNALGAGAPATTPNNFIDKIHKTGIALAISATNANKVYVSVSPFAQYDNDVDNLYYTPSANVLRTTTGNTPFTSIMGTAPNNLPNRYIMDFAISPTNDDSVWVAVGGFGTPHVYVTGNGGTTWTSKDPGPSAGGLPDVPTNAIMFDPNNPKIIYIGNDFGVYVSPNGGNTWQDFNGGFWDATEVVDLVPGPNNKIRAATHGKGMFETILYSIDLPLSLLQLTGADEGDHIRLDWQTGDETFMAHLQLERSTDGNHFQSVTEVGLQGGAGPHTYTFNDYGASQLSGHIFYRVKTIDLTGQVNYSNIVTFDRGASDRATVLGTLFQNSLRVQVSSSSQQTIALLLYDMAGKLLATKSAEVYAGTSNTDWDGLAWLPRGVYLITTRTRTGRFTQKVTRF